MVTDPDAALMLQVGGLAEGEVFVDDVKTSFRLAIANVAKPSTTRGVEIASSLRSSQ